MQPTMEILKKSRKPQIKIKKKYLPDYTVICSDLICTMQHIRISMRITGKQQKAQMTIQQMALVKKR